MYSGSSLSLLPAAMEKYNKMQLGSSPITKGGIVLAYKVAPGSAPAAILQVFYNVSQCRALLSHDTVTHLFFRLAQGATPPSTFISAFNGIPFDSSSLGIYTYTGLIDILSPIFENPTNLR